MLEGLQIELNRFDWSGVSGISDMLMVVLSIFLLIGLRQGAKSIKESSLSRDADILRWAMSEMDALKPKIRVITDAHKRAPFCDCENIHVKEFCNSWGKEEMEAAQSVGVNLQRIGYMSLHNLISRHHFMNIWGPMYLASWYALESWVKHKRLELDEPQNISDGAYSRMYLEQYAKYCEDNLPLPLVENERKRFNLPPLPKNKTSKYGLLKAWLLPAEKLNVKRKIF
ncbi:MAG: hypothetical protein JXR04_02895 [Bermanella sp.]